MKALVSYLTIFFLLLGGGAMAHGNSGRKLPVHHKAFSHKVLQNGKADPSANLSSDTDFDLNEENIAHDDGDGFGKTIGAAVHFSSFALAFQAIPLSPARLPIPDISLFHHRNPSPLYITQRTLRI